MLLAWVSLPSPFVVATRHTAYMGLRFGLERRPGRALDRTYSSDFPIHRAIVYSPPEKEPCISCVCVFVCFQDGFLLALEDHVLS